MDIKNKRIAIFIYLIVNVFTLHSQVYIAGIPPLKNYTKNEYKAATQNWAITQNKEGILFFANNTGMLVFDGLNWELYPVINNTGLRSVLADSLNRIYVGAFNEFGYFYLDELGHYQYVSLSNQIPEENRNFDEIWRIHIINNKIYFQSFKNLFVFKDDKLIQSFTNQKFNFSFNINDTLCISVVNKGLCKVHNKELELTKNKELNKLNSNIWSVIEFNDNHFLVATNTEGIFKFKNGKIEKWKTNINERLIESKIYSGVKINDNLFAIGTIKAGIFLIDSSGVLKNHINTQTKLQNNTILSLFVDNAKNLWVGLDNGIAYIETNAPFELINEGMGVYGTGYASAIYDGKLYLGTNQAVFYKEINYNSFNKFEIVKGTEGQVWNLQLIDGTLFCGHHEGTFIIEGEEATKISDIQGSWMMLKTPNPDILLGGNYTQLSVYKKHKNNKWNYIKKIEGFNESSRTMELDDSMNIWMSHGYKGVYKIKLNQEFDSLITYKYYNNEHGFPEKNAITGFKFNHKIAFSTAYGIYKYNPKNDNFIIYDTLNKLFQNYKAYLPQKDKKGNIWFFAHNSLIKLEKKEDKYIIRDKIFRKYSNSFMNSFEHLNLINENNVLIGNENGFIVYDNQPYDVKKLDLKVVLSNIVFSNSHDTLQIAQSLDNNSFKKIKTEYSNNAVVFNFSLTFYENTDKTEYAFQLEGYDNKLSDWKHFNKKEYTNLPPGKYTFKVKARNVYGIESNFTIFRFTVKPPWYRTVIAYFFYVIFFIIISYLTAKYIIKKIEKDKNELIIKQQQELEKQQEEHLRESLIAEKEIVKLKNEKLQMEIEKTNKDFDLKKKELASVTLQITHKNELLNKVKEQIEQISYKVNKQAQKELKQLNKAIAEEINLDKDWNMFKKHFDEVHVNFFKRLKEKYPALTPKDLKLCAYLRLNLSTKEIAPLMSISVRGVEISRYRLRKKIGVDSNDNLFEFMMNV